MTAKKSGSESNMPGSQFNAKMNVLSRRILFRWLVPDGPSDSDVRRDLHAN
jgi:hypothetical protein